MTDLIGKTVDVEDFGVGQIIDTNRIFAWIELSPGRLIVVRTEDLEPTTGQ